MDCRFGVLYVGAEDFYVFVDDMSGETVLLEVCGEEGEFCVNVEPG